MSGGVFMFSNNEPQAPFGALFEAVQRRNTIADWMFYDVGALSASEFALLSQQTNREVAILVVEPADAGDSIRIQKFETFKAFRAEPGDLLRHFTIAGVGSSDVGAAAFGRTLANHLDAPVGAIVSGYGMADILSEALGGWYFFGTSNRALNLMTQVQQAFSDADHDRAESAEQGSRSATAATFSPDTGTLLQLLSEEERHVETVLGHSKGCLSISYALREIASRSDRSDFDRARDIDVITTGAVIAFPEGLNRLKQYLGSLDWFGGMNSRSNLEYTSIPGAWHHLNTGIPMHMDLERVLAGEYAENAQSPAQW